MVGVTRLVKIGRLHTMVMRKKDGKKSSKKRFMLAWCTTSYRKWVLPLLIGKVGPR